MLFPKTNEAPASPPTSSPIRRATDRRHLRQILTAEAEVLRRMELDRSRSARHYVQSSLASRSHVSDTQGSRRRRRLSSTLHEGHGTDAVPSMTSRDSTVSASLPRAQPAAGSVGVSRPRSPLGSAVHQVSRRGYHHGLAESPQPPLIDNHRSALLSSSTFNTSTSSNNRQTTNDTRNHREDNTMQEMLSSSEYPWIQTLNGQRRAASRFHNGHGFGIVNALNRSASHGDLQNDVEYVTIQPVQRVDQVPSHRRRGVSRFDNYSRERLLQQVRRRNRDQLLGRLETAPVADTPQEYGTEDPEFDEDDLETASDIVSDRDSSFTSSTAARFVGSRVNSFRFHEEAPSSPTSTAAATHNADTESAVASFAGFERLYDISSQIEAAMNDIERLSLQPGWSRRPEPSHPPATPQTHRSCFEVSEDEDEEEEVDWGARIRDAVFIVDDLETDSESEEEALPVSPFNHVDEALHHITDAQWLSSVEDTYSYY